MDVNCTNPRLSPLCLIQSEVRRVLCDRNGDLRTQGVGNSRQETAIQRDRNQEAAGVLTSSSIIAIKKAIRGLFIPVFTTHLIDVLFQRRTQAKSDGSIKLATW
jgi:hypothetical protein